MRQFIAGAKTVYRRAKVVYRKRLVAARKRSIAAKGRASRRLSPLGRRGFSRNQPLQPRFFLCRQFEQGWILRPFGFPASPPVEPQPPPPPGHRYGRQPP